MPRPIVMPSFGMYTVEGTLVKWLEATGAEVAEGVPILEIETDKATQEVVAPAGGRLHQVAAEGDHVVEQGVLGYILAEGEQPPEPPAGEPSDGTRPAGRGPRTAPKPTGDPSTAPSPATPAARRLAAEHGIDLAALSGSGPRGRIVEADVQAALAAPPARVVPGERVPLSPMRRAIANRLRHSVAEAVPCTLTREVGAELLAQTRDDHGRQLGRSLPFDAYFAKLLAVELREHPDLNVVLDGDSLVRLEDVHIGVAVAVPGGLVTPVVRNADTEPLEAVAAAIEELAGKAAAGTLRAVDLEGGSSTITNLGGHGIDAFTPVLNPPQPTILGIGRIRPTAVVDGSGVTSVRAVVLSLTFDHRVADGAVAAGLLAGLDRRMNDAGSLPALGSGS